MTRHGYSMLLCIVWALTMSFGAMAATTLYSEDFQTGTYNDWTVTGNGHDGANYYLGNWSLRLDGLRQAEIEVSSAGYEDVSLSMELAAAYLVYGDYCYAEYSTDGGSSWHTVLQLGHTQSDSVMRRGQVLSGLDDNPDLRLRFRAYTLYYHNCYGDNIELTGVPTGSSGSPFDPLSGNGNVTRTALGYGFLTGTSPVSLIDYAHYALPEHAANPDNTFEGRLTLTGQANGHVEEAGWDDNLQYYAQAAQLPAFAFDYVQDGTHIIPVQRGKIIGSHPSWIYILEPGRVWNENGDNGYSRVALPFSLQERNQDCTWNGVITFLFKDDGSTSDAVYQIAGGTCAYMKLNFWGRLQASYTPQAVTGAAQLRSNFENHLASRMPIKPISELATDYPGSGVNVNNIGSDVAPTDMTIYGVAYNGVHYVGGCQTRKGPYPYCDVLDVPSYSTAKSVNGGYGLMRLEYLYPGVTSESIGTWVSQCNGSQWIAPSLQNALDMATGNYTSSGFEVDEASQAMSSGFFVPDTNYPKSTFACSYPYKVSPGTQFVYHTTDTYLLGRAMNAYHQDQLNDSNADFFDDVLVNDVYAPLGLSPTAQDTQRTRDSAAQPYTGYGMVFVRDDVVKLAEFMNNDQGKIDGNQILDPTMVASTLQPGSSGLPAGSSADRYHNGFWYYDLNQSPTRNYGCTGAKWVPYMSGFGGISVVLLPNGMVYYNFSDGYSQAWISSADELDKIAPMCP